MRAVRHPAPLATVRSKRNRLITLAASACSLFLTLAVLTPPSPASADHAGASPGRIHAGNTYGWYQFGVERHEFLGGLPSYWKKSGNGIVRNQNGMLTLMSTRSGSLAATLALPGKETGRWEIRLKAARMGTVKGAKQFKVVTELIPAAPRPYRCGGRSLALENFRLGKNRVRTYIRTLPNHSYRASLGRHLGDEQWHTFALEVDHDHISWFVDAHVIATERRPEAMDLEKRQVRFELQAVEGQTMNPARIQVDWLRHWTMRAPNERPITAPGLRLGKYNQSC